MSIVKSIPLKFEEYSPQYKPQHTAQNVHVLRLSFTAVDQIYIPSQSGLSLIAGAVESDARIAINGLTTITENAGIQSNIATISGCTVTLADVGYDLANRFATQLAAGVGTRHKKVEIFAFDPAEQMQESHLIYTFIIEGYQNTKDGKRKLLNLRDVSRDTAREIYTEKEWTITQSVGLDTMFINIASGPDDDYRFARHPINDNRYPGETIGYMRFGSDGEIWSYSQRNLISEGVYQYTVRDRGLFGSERQSFDVDPAEPVENNQKVQEHIYYHEDVRDALSMATLGTTFDGRTVPEHWAPFINHDYLNLVALGNAPYSHPVEVEAPKPQEAKTFYESVLLSTMNDSVFRINNKGELTFQLVPHAIPDAPAVIQFDKTNVDLSSLSPLKKNQTDLADTIVGLWDYNAATDKFENKTIVYDQVAAAVHQALGVKTIELPAIHTGVHSFPQLNNKLIGASERYSHPTETISFDCKTSMRWVNVGTLVRAKFEDGVIIDDSTGVAQDLDRTFVVIGRRYNPSTRKIRYFLWGSSGVAVSRSESEASSHIPDEEFRRNAIDIATVLPVVNGVLSGIHSIAPGKYYHAGPLRLAPDFYCTFTARGAKFQLCVEGALIVQAANPFEAKGMGIHMGGLGARSLAQSAQPGEPGYFGKSVGGGGFTVDKSFARHRVLEQNIPIFSHEGYVYTPLQGVENAEPVVQTVPFFDLALNDGQFTGIPADLSGSGGAGGGGIVETDRDLDGFAAAESVDPVGRPGVPAPTTTHRANGRDGVYGGMGVEFWSRGGGWDGAGGIDVSGGDVDDTVITPNYESLLGGAAGRSQPGVFVWIQDDPRQPLPEITRNRVKAFTGRVDQEGVRSSADQTRWLAPYPDLTHSYHNVIERRNLALSAARAMYSPKPAILKRRVNQVFRSLAIARQEDGQIELIVSTSTAVPPLPPLGTQGQPGDLGLTAIELAGTNLTPPGWIKDNNNIWQPIVDWDALPTDYTTLLRLNRSDGTTISILSDERPVGYPAGTHWLDNTTGLEWILGNTPAEDRPFRDKGRPVGRNLLDESKFSQTKLGAQIWGFTRDSALEPYNALDRLATDLAALFVNHGELEGEYIPTGTSGGTDTIPPVESISLTATANSITVSWTQPTDQTLIASTDVLVGTEIIASGATTPHTITGRAASTEYLIKVVNVGATGNRSAERSESITTAADGSAGQLGIVLSDAGRVVSGTAYQNNVSIVIEPGRQITLTLANGYQESVGVGANGAFAIAVPASQDAQLGTQASLYTNNGSAANEAQLTFTYEL